MTEPHFSTAERARQRGNDLYKQGKLREAANCYREARNLAPSDPAPVSNLSAVMFELGRYDQAAKQAQDAVALTEKASTSKKDEGLSVSSLTLQEDSSPFKQKLYLRLARCFLHRLQLSEARDAVALYNASPARDAIEEAIKISEELEAVAPVVKTARAQIFNRLPRYKPCLQDEPEYYPLGHDQSEPIFDMGSKNTMKSDSVSALFCGIGDGRHLLSTFLYSGLGLGKGPTDEPHDTPSNMHCTLVDLKPAALSRLLILLELLSEIAGEGISLPGSESRATQDTLWVASYLYLGHVLPPFVRARLRSTIVALIQTLERDGTRGLRSPVTIPPSTVAQILHHLRIWSQPLDSLYSTENLREIVGEGIQKRKWRRMMTGATARSGDLEGAPPPPSCARDVEIFDEVTIIPPPAEFVTRHEPGLRRLLKSFNPNSSKGTGITELEDYVDSTWAVNMTLLDMDWETKKDRYNLELPADEPGSHMAKITSMEGDALSMLRNTMYPTDLNDSIPGVRGIIGLMSFYLKLVASAMNLLRSTSNLRLEMIAGEMTDVMERMRFGCMTGLRSKKVAAKFPTTFDRIQLSNIPDYIGGLLAPVHYATPLLKNTDAHLQFNCLLNSPRFKSHEHFQSEYLLMHDKRQIADHFGAELYDHYEGDLQLPSNEFYMGQQYWAWRRVSNNTENAPLPPGKQLTRARLEKWLYGFFLKISLPAVRNPDHSAAIYSPLNLTAWFRLVAHLHDKGYPAHWLATVLENLSSGTIKTTARAPTKEDLNAQDVDKAWPLRQMSVAPWLGEFTTLLSIWRRLIPFGFVTAKDAAPPLKDICLYSLSFPDFAVPGNVRLRVPHFTLVFYHTADFGVAPRNLREMLLDDESGDGSSRAGEIRKGGVHVVSTFTWDTDTRTAKFWMRADLADRLVAPTEWTASVWRTDDWSVQVAEVPVAGRLVKGDAWV